MKHCDTLILPRWCVPVEPANEALTGHAVAIADGRILDVLPASEARERYQPSVILERDDHVLIPGLVNAHTHAAMALLRGISDLRPLERWLKDAIWPVEQRWVSPDFVRDGAELAITEMLKGGVTCFSDQYFFPEVVAETANSLNIRAVVGTPILEFPTPWANDTAEYLSKAADLVHDPYVDHPLISTCYAPHSSAALSDDGFRELRVQADQLDIPVQIHLHETEAEIAASIRETGERPFERLDRLGLVNSLMLAVHAVHVTDDEVVRMADAGVAIAHCPKSNLKLGSGIAPIGRYIEAGIDVGAHQVRPVEEAAARMKEHVVAVGVGGSELEPAHRLEVVQVQRHPGGFRHRHHMNCGVGGAAQDDDDAQGVLKRLASQDVAGFEVGL